MNGQAIGPALRKARRGWLLSLCASFLVGVTATSGVSPAGASTPGTWTATGSMTSARIWHTATLLSTGQVLVAGGCNGNPCTGAEVYNPRTATWTATGSMVTSRMQFAAVALPGGKVLALGGLSNYGRYLPMTAKAELYDPGTGTWTATGSMHIARQGPAAILLPNGKVLAAGGTGPCGGGLFCILTSAELYDPATGTWAYTGSMTVARQENTMTLLRNGKVLAAGGIGGPYGLWLSSAELYDPGAGTWASTGSMTTQRADHTATLLPSGQVLVAGGDHSMTPGLASAELFNPATGTWTATGSMHLPREYHTATLLLNGQALVAGGATGANSVTAGTELYNPATGTWSLTGAMHSRRMNFTETLLCNGQVLVAGGADAYTYPPPAVSSADLYTPLP